MKDIAHHRKFLQKKVLKEVKQRQNQDKMPFSRPKYHNESSPTKLSPEFEGEKFDPHHRKPRLLKRINYH